MEIQNLYPIEQIVYQSENPRDPFFPHLVLPAKRQYVRFLVIVEVFSNNLETFNILASWLEVKACLEPSVSFPFGMYATSMIIGICSNHNYNILFSYGTFNFWISTNHNKESAISEYHVEE